MLQCTVWYRGNHGQDGMVQQAWVPAVGPYMFLTLLSAVCRRLVREQHWRLP